MRVQHHFGNVSIQRLVEIIICCTASKKLKLKISKTNQGFEFPDLKNLYTHFIGKLLVTDQRNIFSFCANEQTYQQTKKHLSALDPPFSRGGNRMNNRSKNQALIRRMHTIAKNDNESLSKGSDVDCIEQEATLLRQNFDQRQSYR